MNILSHACFDRGVDIPLHACSYFTYLAPRKFVALKRCVETLTYGLPSANASDLTPAEEVVADFVQKLASFLSVNVSANNYTEQWTDTHPDDTPADIQGFVGTTWATLCSLEPNDLVRKPLLEKYSAKYEGRIPYLNPSTNGTWAYGDTL